MGGREEGRRAQGCEREHQEGKRETKEGRRARDRHVTNIKPSVKCGLWFIWSLLHVCLTGGTCTCSSVEVLGCLKAMGKSGEDNSDDDSQWKVFHEYVI